MTSPFSAVNHIGYVVSDLDVALQFFTELLGFEAVLERRGNILPSDDIQTRRFGTDPSASGRFAFLRLADALVEVLEWSAPNQNQTAPLNSDFGGRHLAISVTDMPVALAKMRQFKGITIREANDAGYIYCATPFGLEIQLIPV